MMIGLMVIASVSGCGKQKYTLNLQGYGFESDKTEYAEGERVTVKYGAVGTDTDYHFYIDDDVKLKEKYNWETGYTLKFTMPAHDVTLRVETSSWMPSDEPEPEPESPENPEGPESGNPEGPESGNPEGPESENPEGPESDNHGTSDGPEPEPESPEAPGDPEPEPEPESPEPTEEPVSEAKTLRFVDVYGEEYETVINENIAKNPYDPDEFRHVDHFLFYEDENYTSRLGVDVSSHQGAFDWKEAKQFGIEFTFLRIGYRGYGAAGSLNADKEFERNYEAARNEGIDVGVYFFAQAINEDEAREEAEFVLDLLDGRELELPIVYDPESILDKEARTDNVSGEQFTKNTEVFCSAIKDAGYQPMIYSNMLWEAFELDLEKLSEYPIWYADYEDVPQTPYMFEFWQYTNTGRIRGNSGDMDLNIQLIPKS